VLVLGAPNDGALGELKHFLPLGIILRAQFSKAQWSFSVFLEVDFQSLFGAFEAMKAVRFNSGGG